MIGASFVAMNRVLMLAVAAERQRRDKAARVRNAARRSWELRAVLRNNTSPLMSSFPVTGTLETVDRDAVDADRLLSPRAAVTHLWITCLEGGRCGCGLLPAV